MDNQIVDEFKFLFRALFQVLYKEDLVELEYHHFATFDELMDLGIERQWLRHLKGQPDMTCVLMKAHTVRFYH